MSGYIAPFYLQQFRLPNGLPLAGGSITSYSNQTSIPKALYFDIALQNACPNPLSLDSAGFAPEFYLGEGLYTLVIKDSFGNIIATRDYVAGSVSSVDLANISATSASYRVKIDENDTNPGYLWYKLSATDTIDLVNTGEKIAINVKNPWKVKANSTDPTPGYISDKIGNTSTIQLSVSAEKLYAEYVGIQPVFEDSPTISWITSGNSVSASVIDSGKVKISSGDTLEYLEEKIQAGSGIVFTQTEDINGKQIHISTTNSTTNAGKVKVTSGDNLEYLADKFIAGDGITISASDNNITITNSTIATGYITSAVTYAFPYYYDTNIGFQNAISAVIPPGIWEIGGTANVAMILSGALPTRAIANITSTMSTLTEDGYEAYAEKNQQDSPMTLICYPKRFTFAVTTVVYMCVYSYGTYSDGRVWGNITAKQVV